MGKLGGDELNYSSDIDLIFVYGDDGRPRAENRGRVPNGHYFAEAASAIVAALESMTDEGYAFRVDLRLRPEGRSGALILSLEGYRTYFADRAELWERQALIKARSPPATPRWRRASSSWSGPSCSGPGSTRPSSATSAA